MTLEEKLTVKIETLQEVAEAEMIGSSEEAAEASGRFAACSLLLAGVSIAQIEAGLHVIPKHWPQYRGWKKIIDQFRGLL